MTKNKKLLDSEDLECGSIALLAKQATARWSIPKKPKTKKMKKFRKASEQRNHTLRDIDLEIQKGKMIGIVGAVGAGKSSLLQALLRELPLESGSISVNGTISYACQEPWVFGGSVRENILFGQEMDNERYNQVVKACALEKDFNQFEHSDRTMIGEKGASLSGGQKARIK